MTQDHSGPFGAYEELDATYAENRRLRSAPRVAGSPFKPLNALPFKVVDGRTKASIGRYPSRAAAEAAARKAESANPGAYFYVDA